MGRVDSKLHKDCCGCALCAKICPKNAILMTVDKEGFAYPKINDDLCIDCGICENSCPFHESESKDFPIDYLISRTKDESVLQKSASGGLFTCISDEIVKNGGGVFGAVYDETFKVHHVGTSEYGVRDRMRDSKYVQSNISDCFDQVFELLKRNKQVLFTGTPCQCSAIKQFLKIKKQDTSNFLLVDIICHGVGSPEIWKKYLEYIKNKYKIGEIVSITTRNKKKGDGYNMTIEGDKHTYYKPNVADPYIYLFCKNLVLRPSCFDCPFKSWNRETDITIGDFQKAKLFHPKYADGKGVSVLLVNSKKGELLLKDVSNSLICERSTKEKSSQINLYQSHTDSLKRNSFFHYYSQHDFSNVLRKFTEEGLFKKIKGSTKRIVKKILSII